MLLRRSARDCGYGGEESHQGEIVMNKNDICWVIFLTLMLGPLLLTGFDVFVDGALSSLLKAILRKWEGML